MAWVSCQAASNAGQARRKRSSAETGPNPALASARSAGATPPAPSSCSAVSSRMSTPGSGRTSCHNPIVTLSSIGQSNAAFTW